jgi:hypothetical protein
VWIFFSFFFLNFAHIRRLHLQLPDFSLITFFLL